MTILAKVKNALRIDGEDHDEELQDLIATAQLLLLAAGIVEAKALDENDAIIRNLYITFSKSHFGADDAKQRYAEAFDSMLTKVSLSSMYNEASPVETVPEVPEVGVDDG